MDATAYPALMFVQNIGQMALCTKNSRAGDARRRDDEEGYATPSVFAGRRVIIAQIPACNPATRYNTNIEGVYKTHHVLVCIIVDGCGNKEGTKDFVEAQLSLVEC